MWNALRDAARDVGPGTDLRAGAAEVQVPRPVVRLGRVHSAPYLRDRIAHRESVYEVGFYDDRPVDRATRILRKAGGCAKLFQERGFKRATGGPAPTLEAEVLGFEEIRMAAVHAARVELRYQLQNELAMLDEQTITVDRAIVGNSFESFVATISKALGKATDRIADAVARATPSAFTPAYGKGPA
jgi:hypothetical protein